MPHAFEQELYNRFAQSIYSWDTEQHPDIYAISFLIDGSGASMDARGREVLIHQITLSYNTLSYFESNIARASSVMEAKWNFAFWLQNSTAQMPWDFEYGTDPPADDLALRDDWCASLGIPIEMRDEGGRAHYVGNFNEEIFALCARVAKALHDKGVIERTFGKPIPIMIHNLESTEGVESTKTANPPGISEEVEAWMMYTSGS